MLQAGGIFQWDELRKLAYTELIFNFAWFTKSF
jgi:hypothetical protein